MGLIVFLAVVTLVAVLTAVAGVIYFNRPEDREAKQKTQPEAKLDSTKETIVKVWFDTERIHVLSSSGNEYSRLLSSFPRLRDATSVQRMGYMITMQGAALRWQDLDEDIHISSFLNPNTKRGDTPDSVISGKLGAKSGKIGRKW